MSIVESEKVVVGELDDIYRWLLSEEATDYRETWRVFVANPRYWRELQSAALGVVRARRLPAECVADVTQEALIVLAERLRRRGNLGFRRQFGEERFLAWIRAVIRSHCRHAADRQRSREPRAAELDGDWAAYHTPSADRRAELADAVASLDKPLCDVVQAYWQAGSIEPVAAQLGLSTTTAWRRFRAAARKLRSRCSPFVASGRLVGITQVVEKW